MRLGIIGADSFHTVALVNQYLKMEAVEIVFVDSTLRGTMKMSGQRQKRFETMLEGKIDLRPIDLYHHEDVDLYLVLNVDSKTHLKTIQILKQYKKPIFVDKPIFTNLDDFDSLSGKIMSSSGLRFTQFIKDVPLQEVIKIEGPLEYVDEVEGYFWYGIHLVEMLQTLTHDTIAIDSVAVFDTYEMVCGSSGAHRFEIIGHYEPSNFKVKVEDVVFELSSYDHLYERLAKAILDVDAWISLEDTKHVIEAILAINALKANKNP